MSNMFVGVTLTFIVRFSLLEKTARFAKNSAEGYYSTWWVTCTHTLEKVNCNFCGYEDFFVAH